MEVASRIVRISAVAGVLYGLPIPLMYKYIPLVLTDLLDSHGPFKMLDIVSYSEYQRQDKITDMLCYTLLLYYILTTCNLPLVYNRIILAMFMYRLVGQILFDRTGDRRYLVYFPNFFLEMSFLFIAIHTLPEHKHKYLSIGLLFILKVLWEYSHHHSKILEKNR